MDAERWRGVVLVVCAGVLYSSAGLFTRALHLDGWTILAWRGIFGALFTLVWMLVEEGRGILRAFSFSAWQWLSLPLLAIGGICYIFALKVTTVADVMVVYATMPFVTSVVAWLWGRERPSFRLIVAGTAALLGVGVMMTAGFGSHGRLLGVALTMLMNISFATMLVGARRSPATNTGVYAVSTAVSAAIGFGLAPREALTPYDMLVLAGFGISTIGLAMALFMAGARRIPPAEVGLLGIVDVVIGPALVWLVFSERPEASAVWGGGIIVAALVWHLWPDLRGASTRCASPAGTAAPGCLSGSP